MKIEEYIEEIEQRAKMQISQAKQDYDTGKNDCKFGVYDKWYRYNHKDDGVAYDIGWQEQNTITQNEKVIFLKA